MFLDDTATAKCPGERFLPEFEGGDIGTAAARLYIRGSRYTVQSVGGGPSGRWRESCRILSAAIDFTIADPTLRSTRTRAGKNRASNYDGGGLANRDRS